MTEQAPAISLSERRLRVLQSIGKGVVERLQSSDETDLLRGFDLIRAHGIPKRIIQESVYSECFAAGLETQSFHKNFLRADLMPVIGPMSVRVTTRSGEAVHDPIENSELPKGEFVSNVYPELESEPPSWGYTFRTV